MYTVNALFNLIVKQRNSPPDWKINQLNIFTLQQTLTVME